MSSWVILRIKETMEEEWDRVRLLFITILLMLRLLCLLSIFASLLPHAGLLVAEDWRNLGIKCLMINILGFCMTIQTLQNVSPVLKLKAV